MHGEHVQRVYAPIPWATGQLLDEVGHYMVVAPDRCPPSLTRSSRYDACREAQIGQAEVLKCAYH